MIRWPAGVCVVALALGVSSAAAKGEKPGPVQVTGGAHSSDVGGYADLGGYVGGYRDLGGQEAGNDAAGGTTGRKLDNYGYSGFTTVSVAAPQYVVEAEPNAIYFDTYATDGKLIDRRQVGGGGRMSLPQVFKYQWVPDYKSTFLPGYSSTYIPDTTTAYSPDTKTAYTPGTITDTYYNPGTYYDYNPGTYFDDAPVERRGGDMAFWVALAAGGFLGGVVLVRWRQFIRHLKNAWTSSFETWASWHYTVEEMKASGVTGWPLWKARAWLCVGPVVAFVDFTSEVRDLEGHFE